jgi:Flp pilus assembly protein TadG
MRCEMGGRQRTFLQRQDGSVILEAALMITVLLMLTFGMVDFGRVMYTSNSLISAAREGARGGAVLSPVDTTAMKNVIRGRFNSYTFGGDTLANSNIAIVDSSALSPPSIKVTVTYPFKWISPFARLIGWTTGSFTSNLHATAQYRYEE